MGYKELRDKAVKAKKVKDLTTREWNPEKPGDSIVGRVTAVEEISIGRNRPFNKYIIETDEGVLSVILGYKLDVVFQQEDPVGRIFEITFKRRATSKKDKEYNEYEIQEIME